MSRKKKSKTEEVQQDLVPNLDNTTDIRLAAEAAIANRVIQPYASKQPIWRVSGQWRHSGHHERPVEQAADSK